MPVFTNDTTVISGISHCAPISSPPLAPVAPLALPAVSTQGLAPAESIPGTTVSNPSAPQVTGKVANASPSAPIDIAERPNSSPSAPIAKPVVTPAAILPPSALSRVAASNIPLPCNPA